MNLVWFIGGLSAFFEIFFIEKKLQVNVIISVGWRSQWGKIFKKFIEKNLIEK